MTGNTDRQRDRSNRRQGPDHRVAVLLCLWLAVLSPAPARGEAAAGATPDSSPVGIAAREAEKRQSQIRAAQELFTDAELDRRDGNHAVAVEKYRTAFRATPSVPAAAAMRESIFKRYQMGAIAWAEQLINEARWDQAEAALVQLMNDAKEANLGAGQIDATVRTLLARLRSDDYYNKAMTPRHLEAVGAVEEGLRAANTLLEIGDFAGARRRYEAVLNLDRTNSAARRGLETLDRLVSEYEEVARNQTRSTLLRQVAEEWETPVPLQARGAGLAVEVAAPAGDQQAEIRGKLGRIIIPQVEFNATPLQTVVEYLTQVAEDLDRTEPDPSKRGINLVVDPQTATNVAQVMQRPITLRLTNAPFETVLKYAAEQAQMKYRVDAFAVTIVPLSASDDTRLVTRTYQVPPGFISGGGAPGAPAGAAPVDPFAAPAPGAGTGGGTLVKRISPREFLENNGITFPEGSLASFNPINSTLVVKNTPDNLSLVEQMILSFKESGTKLVRVDLKLIQTTDRILNELGFDWLVGQFNVGGNGVFAGGGTPGNQADGRAISDYAFVAPGGVPVGQNPVTAGLRSGTAYQSRLTIDDVINRDSPTLSGSTAAPGVLSLAGVFTDPQFQVMLRALSQNKGNDLLSTASVVTRPGERAIIKQVREFIYPTEYDPPEIPNQIGTDTITIGGGGGGAGISSYPVTPATPAAFETRELGRILEVEPVVGADNFTVDLNLTTDLSDFVGFINYGSPIESLGLTATGASAAIELTPNRILMPVFDAIKENTQVTIYDGQTIAVGGLLGESVNLVEDKVPLLGDTPVVGRFFRSNIEERARRALVLFATVRIIDPAGTPVNDLAQIGQNGNGNGATPPPAAN